jgi:Family of unknown function (DUF6459)
MPSRTHLPEPLPSTETYAPPGARIEPGMLALRLATVPDGAPPYDCETHGAGCPAIRDAARTIPDARSPAPMAAARAPSLPMAPSLPAAAPTLPAVLVAAPAPAAVLAAAPAPAPAIPGAAAAAGTTAAWPRQFAPVVVEVLAGVRPARQILPWTTDRARAQLRRLGPLLVCDRRPKIQRVVTSRPTASVVEMTVVVNFGVRTRALAMRFEHVAGRQAAPGLPARPARWLCTEIEAG